MTTSKETRTRQSYLSDRVAGLRPSGIRKFFDIAATMQVITSVIESWVREYPEQWLWLHRRWR